VSRRAAAFVVSVPTLDDAWDRAIGRAGARAGFGQTSAWAGATRAASGSETIAVEAPSGDARALVTVPAGRRSPRARLFGVTATVIDGPVLIGDAHAGLAELLPVLEARCSAAGVGALTLLPPPRADWVDARSVELLAARGYEDDRWATVLIPITGDDEELLAAMDRSARKAIRRATSAGMTVERCETVDEYRTAFRPAYEAARRAEGLGGLPPGDVDAMAARIDVDYQFFLARDAADGAVLGTLGTYRCNGLATEITSALTTDARARSLPAQDLLHWEALRFHRALGDSAFDMAGFNPDAASDKERGIARFKQKFGGTTVELHRFTKVLRLRALQRLASRIRSR
jgi:hypothetical protein